MSGWLSSWLLNMRRGSISLCHLPKPQNFWLNTVINSHGLFVFFDEPCFAGIVLLTMAFTNWWLVLSSLICCIIANVFAVFALKTPLGLIRAGVFGVNSVHLGLCLGVSHPPTISMACAVVFLACTCATLCHAMSYGFERFGLSPGAFPQLIILLLWDVGLRDALGIAAHPAPPPMQQAITMDAGIKGMLTGVANVHFLPPLISILVLINVLWLLEKPAILISVWLGAVLGVLVDVVTGAPAAQFWTGLSGLNAILTYNIITFVLCTPSQKVFLVGAGFAVFAALGARVLGGGGSTWPSAITLLIFSTLKNEWRRRQVAPKRLGREPTKKATKQSRSSTPKKKEAIEPQSPTGLKKTN